MSSATETTTTEPSAHILIPLHKLKKSPKNARKMPHSPATIEAYAASIAAKGILQNLVVEPECDDAGSPTGFYLVTIGEGRRQAQLLRLKRKEIKKTEPIPCVVNVRSDAFEISLDENVTREAMHPADQFEAFRTLVEERGMGVEDIAARFGLTAHTVRQRLRLGAVSPRLMEAYRNEELTLEQLMAFTVCEDHEKQEAIFARLGSWQRDASSIRRVLTETNVRATDRRARLIGINAYVEAGGTILRDLFTEDGGGYFENATLLDQLVEEKLTAIAVDCQQNEGWAWYLISIDFPHAHGLRRVYPKDVPLSEEDEAAQYAARTEYDNLYAEYEEWDEVPDDITARLQELEDTINHYADKRQAYTPADISRSGLIVSLGSDGQARIERGFQRPEDVVIEEQPDTPERTEAATGTPPAPEDVDDGDSSPAAALSDALIRDLTAHRTLALRLALGEQPSLACRALTHALALSTFWRSASGRSCLDIRPVSTDLGPLADGLEASPAAEALMARHTAWAARMPQEPEDLWDIIAAMDNDTVLTLLAHCVSLTVDAVKYPHCRATGKQIAADQLATALSLDMAEHWKPTTRSYFGRVTKAHIVEAVSEAAGAGAAARITGLKKQAMADEAEQLVTGTGWLPPLLRPVPAADRSTDNEAEPDAQAA